MTVSGSSIEHPSLQWAVGIGTAWYHSDNPKKVPGFFIFLGVDKISSSNFTIIAYEPFFESLMMKNTQTGLRRRYFGEKNI